jgi:hypothetical protein
MEGTMKTRLLLVLPLVLVAAAAILIAPLGAQPSTPSKPSRVLLIVLDGMRADYLDRFDLPNLEALRDGGVSFPSSQVGYMSSITVISHNVIASGQLPRNQGWANEIYRDDGNVLGGGAGSLYVMSSASCSDFDLLTRAAGYPKLEQYLGALEADGDARFISVAQKDRSACGVGHPADANDVIFGMARLSSPGIKCDGSLTNHRYRFPRGVNVPASMAAPCSRYYVDGSEDYGTNSTSPALLYPLDGHRFVPGFNSARLGGDVWSVDAAIEMMQADAADADTDDWRGMFVGLGGPDKMAHMWGPNDAVTGAPGSVNNMIHLPGELKLADEQVGDLVAELEDEGLLDETLIVVTADHGMTDAERFHGNTGPPIDGGNFNWYYGAETGTRADESYLTPSPAIAALAGRIGGNLAFSYQDTHVGVWLKDRSKASREAAAAAMRQLPDAIATFRLNGGDSGYVRDWVSSSMTDAERSWFNRNAQKLINTMAASNNADAVALLADDVTYSVQGDHGGHQADNQLIPIMFSWPGLQAGARLSTPIRNVDILPTILELLGIAPTHSLDGEAVPLPQN